MQTHSILIAISAAAAATACITEPDAGSINPHCLLAETDGDRGGTCRSCEINPDCTSGVCLEASGACAEEARLVHVTQSGADVGTCTRARPCRTLQYALGQVTASRDVIRLTTGHLVTASSIFIDRPVAIDATGTAIDKPAGIPTFIIGAHAGAVTLEGLKLYGAPDPITPTITVARGSTLRISRSVLDTVVIDVGQGALELRDSKLTTSFPPWVQPSVASVRCTNGTVRARRAVFERTTITATGCHLNVSRSRFDEISDGSISATGGVAVIENNLVIQAEKLADTMFLTDLGPGSTVRFNTFVNTSGKASDGVALYCDGTPHVTSNIFAYGSKHPLGPPLFRCPATHSLFDEVALIEQAVGEGNLIADGDAIFADREYGDYHLACNSQARSASELGLTITEDFDGNPRPMPFGSRADIGAFEAP